MTEEMGRLHLKGTSHLVKDESAAHTHTHTGPLHLPLFKHNFHPHPNWTLSSPPAIFFFERLTHPRATMAGDFLPMQPAQALAPG